MTINDMELDRILKKQDSEPNFFDLDWLFCAPNQICIPCIKALEFQGSLFYVREWSEKTINQIHIDELQCVEPTPNQGHEGLKAMYFGLVRVFPTENDAATRKKNTESTSNKMSVILVPAVAKADCFDHEGEPQIYALVNPDKQGLCTAVKVPIERVYVGPQFRKHVNGTFTWEAELKEKAREMNSLKPATKNDG